jgi:hypothetical protein
MIARALSAAMASSWALPAAGIAALGLLYLFFVLCSALGRLRLYRRPLNAPLITDDGPAIGESLPVQVMETLARKLAPPSGWGSGRRVAVLFAAPGCVPCVDLLPQIAPVARRWAGDTRVVVVLETGGILPEHPSMQAWVRLPVPVILDEDGALGAAAGIRHRPVAILVDPLGLVLMKGVVSTGAQLEALIGEWGVPQGERLWKRLEVVTEAG